jgi:hypothetical protein
MLFGKDDSYLTAEEISISYGIHGLSLSSPPFKLNPNETSAV